MAEFYAANDDLLAFNNPNRTRPFGNRYQNISSTPGQDVLPNNAALQDEGMMTPDWPKQVQADDSTSTGFKRLPPLSRDQRQNEFIRQQQSVVLKEILRQPGNRQTEQELDKYYQMGIDLNSFRVKPPKEITAAQAVSDINARKKLAEMQSPYADTTTREVQDEGGARIQERYGKSGNLIARTPVQEPGTRYDLYRPSETGFKGQTEEGKKWTMKRGRYGEATDYQEIEKPAKEPKTGETTTPEGKLMRWTERPDSQTGKVVREYSPVVDAEGKAVIDPKAVDKQKEKAIQKEVSAVNQVWKYYAQSTTAREKELKKQIDALSLETDAPPKKEDLSIYEKVTGGGAEKQKVFEQKQADYDKAKAKQDELQSQLDRLGTLRGKARDAYYKRAEKLKAAGVDEDLLPHVKFGDPQGEPEVKAPKEVTGDETSPTSQDGKTLDQKIEQAQKEIDIAKDKFSKREGPGGDIEESQRNLRDLISEKKRSGASVGGSVNVGTPENPKFDWSGKKTAVPTMNKREETTDTTQEFRLVKPFNSLQEAEAANLPSGTIIQVMHEGRLRRARVK